MRWETQRRRLWSGASRWAGLGGGGILLTGIVAGAGVLVALGACLLVLCLTFGRRARSDW